jgi:hypothetical protein
MSWRSALLLRSAPPLISAPSDASKPAAPVTAKTQQNKQSGTLLDTTGGRGAAKQAVRNYLRLSEAEMQRASSQAVLPIAHDCEDAGHINLGQASKPAAPVKAGMQHNKQSGTT